jgi:poly(3-hydroxybutyrate) depolymerase
VNKKPSIAFGILVAAWLVPSACQRTDAPASGGPGGANGASADAGNADAGNAGGADASAADGSSSSDATPGVDSGACVPPPVDNGSDCSAPLAPGTDRKCTIIVGGTARELLLYAPKSYDPCSPAPLVVDAHGSSETDGLGSGWRLVADREGFIVAQPQGIGNQWSQADADFMVQIATVVAKAAQVDPKRVYMTGISNGGELTYWTGCKDTDVFRAFAPVSGFGQMTCALTHPAPMISFHSADDKLVAIADGQAAFQMWVTSNHCQRGPTSSWQFGGPSTDPREVCLTSGSGSTWKLAACDQAAPATVCQTWDQCDGGVEATFCTVPADKQHHFDTTGGHILYINGTNLSLAAVAWEYFKKLP